MSPIKDIKTAYIVPSSCRDRFKLLCCTDSREGRGYPHHSRVGQNLTSCKPIPRPSRPLVEFRRRVSLQHPTQYRIASHPILQQQTQSSTASFLRTSLAACISAVAAAHRVRHHSLRCVVRASITHHVLLSRIPSVSPRTGSPNRSRHLLRQTRVGGCHF